MNNRSHFVIVGGGLGGALLACYLGKAGYETHVFEMRDDLRRAEVGGGRSINLALSYRGLCALGPVGLVDEVLKSAVPMRGRMIHGRDGELAFQSYGVDDSQAINSVSRNGLNAILLDAAAKFPNVSLTFNEKCTNVDFATNEVEFANTKTQETHRICAGAIFSADGAFSAVRAAMQKRDRFEYHQHFLAHGYKELHIPPGPGGSFRIEKNALHIWPRKSLMTIALPNADGSYTVTLFWPFEGPGSFEAIHDKDDLLRFFNEHFPDAVPVMPTLVDDYFRNPTGSMVTVRCRPWHLGGRVCLLGDAAHAVVPFYGQGMNASFEDVLVLSECMERHRPNLEVAFAEYEARRKPNADALADLAIGNFVEMRDKTGSRMFLLKKKGEKLLAKALPGWYRPLYSMVTFSRIPYADAVVRARLQSRIVAVIAAAIVLVAALAWVCVVR